jgi:hypothetical protein
MVRILKSLVLLTLIVELVLPVGWCCRPAKATTTSVSINSGSERPCCHARMAQKEKPARSRSPQLPTSKCCCSVDSVAPERAAQTIDVESMPALPVMVPAVGSLRHEGHLAQRGAIETGPPLNVLLCVWLC